MKLKRFVSIVIALTMVLSIVPAFSLTAFAAGTTGVIDALNGEVLWACPDGSFNDTAIGTAFPGWSSNITSGYVNVKTYSGVGNVIQYYVNGTENKTTITSPGYGDGTEEKLIIEWKMKRQNPSDLYFDFSFTDKSGTEIAFLKLDRNYTSVSGEYYMGYPAEGTDCAIVATNNGDGTHKVEYYVAGNVVSTVASKEGTVNGFGGIKSSNGRWSASWNHVGFANLTIGAVYPAAATEVEVTVEYTADGQVVKTVNGRYDTSAGETGIALDAFTYTPNGGNYIYTAAATTMSESGTIAMTKQDNWNGKAVGDKVTYGGKKYQITGTNLIPNGDFSQGTTGWYAGNGAAAGFFTSNGDGTMTLSSGGTGQGGASSLYRAWKVEPNTTYVYTYTSTGGGQYHKNSLGASFKATGSDGSNVILQGAAGTNTVVFTTGASENYLIASYRWLGTGEKFGNYGLYEVTEVVETTADTVKAGMDSISLPLATKTSITVPTTSSDAYGYESTISWTSSDADVLAADGTVTAPSDITIVTLTPSTTYNGNTVTGDAHTVYVFPGSVAGTEYNSGSGYYDIGTDNIISANGTDASFEDADGNQSLTGWLAHTGAQTNSAMNWGDATVDVVPDGNWAYIGWWNDGITGSNYCTIDTMWPVEAGTYYLSFYAKKPAGGSTTYVYFSEDNAHHTAVDQLTSEAWYELVSPGSDWAKYQYIITAETAGYIGFTSYNIGNNGSRGTWFDDFELYSAVQAAEDLVSVTNPEDITVIAGNEPVLPKTVTGVGERGSAMTVDVEWNSADYTNTTTSAKTVTVTGTAAGMSVSVNVVVLPETFAMDDVVAYAGQNTAAINYFPVPVTGTATFEFDVVFNKLVNSTITLGDAEGNGGNCPIFGGTGDAISIQTNTNGVNIRSWTDGSADRNVTTPVITGDIYRFLIVTDIDSDTWSAIMTDKNGIQTVIADGHGYRKLVDQIDSITVLDNNSSADTINVSNIKVYAPAQASAITTFTFVANGSVSDTYTVKGTNADTISIPHYDGHIMKTREIDGTTVTATYEETTTSVGSWYMRNNFTDDNWISQSKYIGSHNAFADDDSVFVNDGGVLYKDTAANWGDVAISKSRTQSVGVVDQLNAGVRYFDVRLSRQADGTFATVHGPAFENFRDVAISMAQWAKENPGEVIILDFQTVRDGLYGGSATGHYEVITNNDSYYGPAAGDDNQYVYDALVQLFEDTGLADYMTTNWDRKYGALTSSGTVTAILPFGKGRAVNCQGGYFVNRSVLNNDVTYVGDSSYSNIVSNLDSTYTSLTDGATISTIHAYTTADWYTSANLLNDAAANNPNWIEEENFYNWMAYGKGDVLLMDDSVSDIDVYYNALNAFNRTGSTYSYTANFTRTDNDVTIDGEQANVPFSTKFTVTSADASAVGTVSIDGTDYTPVTAYNVALMQFNTDSVQPTGDVTLTFPMVSTDNTTVDVLLSADGKQVLAKAALGEAISFETSSLGNYMLATKAADGVELTVQYLLDGNVIAEVTDEFAYGAEVYNIPAGNFYLADGDWALILKSAEEQKHVASTSDVAGTVFTVELTLESENAVLADTFGDNDGKVNNNSGDLLFVGSSGVSDPGDKDDDGEAVMKNNGGNVGSPRVPVLTFNVPEVKDGQAVKLNLYVAKANQNLNNGSMKLAVGTADLVVDEATGYKATDLANTENIIWSDQMFTAASGDAVSGKRDVNSWVTVDVTSLVKNATGDTITFALYAPTAGAYVVDRENAVLGGAYAGKAAYLSFEDAAVVTADETVVLTKNGTAMTEAYVTDGDSVRVKAADGKSKVTDGTATYEYAEKGTVVETITDGATFTVVPELPTATVAPVENDDLTFALNFVADEVTEKQLNYYGSWYADFELTVNGTVDETITFYSVEGEGVDGYLSGEYEGHDEGEGWINVPYKAPVTINKGDTIKIMEFAAEMMGEKGLKYTYKEVYESVKDFDCGVYFTPEFLAANPDLEVTLELRMYNPANEEEVYTIGDTHVFTIPELPTATVTPVENDDLTFALNFVADEVTEKQLNYYGDWYADFEFTVDNTVDETITLYSVEGEGVDGYLSGEYEGHDEGEGWINVPYKAPVTISKGDTIKIMAFAAESMGDADLKVTYNDVLTTVKDFDCGVYFTPEFLAANPNMVVTLELRMYNPENENISYTIGDTYTFTAPKVAATVTTAEGKVTTYETFAAALEAVTVTTDVITVYETVILTENVDLKGATVKVAESLSATPAFRVLDDITVTNGTVDATDGTSTYAFIVGNSTTAGTLTIADGTYKGVTSVVSVTNGTLTITGGEFEATEYNGAHEFTLNCIDANYNNGSAVVEVSGGKFYKFNPANNAAEGKETSFAADGYVATLEGDYYTVVAGVAKVDDVYYATLQEAFDAANGKTVTLLAESNEEAVVVADETKVTFENAGNYTGTMELGAYAWVITDAEIEVTGDKVVTGKEVTADGVAPTKFGYTTEVLGLTMVNGAQVRIGDGVDEVGKVVAEDSGIRFITQVDYIETLAADSSEFGVVVTAEKSNEETEIAAKTFQDDDKTVFTSAIVNLAVSNYNRKFTATPYVTVDGIRYVADERESVTRSIYQVSAGIMKNGSDGDDKDYTVDAAVKKVLNAYVNQTGIRLSYTSNGIAVEANKYTGDVFFTVTSESDGDDGFNVTIAPDTTWGTPAEIAEWWKDYVRVNNNKSAAKGYISGATFADGVLTFNFDTTADSNN